MSKKQSGPATPPAWKRPWQVAFYEAPDGELPGLSWLDSFPDEPRKQLISIIIAVAQRPPPSFPASGSMWAVMEKDMAGLFEARDEHDGWLYRIFCVLDRDSHAKPTVVVISGGKKPERTVMESWIYKEAQRHRDGYTASRRIDPKPWPPPPRS